MARTSYTTERMDQYQANGWRFEVTPDGTIRPTNFRTDDRGRPTFERWRDAAEAQSYLALSGY